MNLNSFGIFLHFYRDCTLLQKSYIYEGADRVRGRGEKRRREGEKRGRVEGEEGAGGGRRGGGRREKRGREEGEGRGKGREGKRGQILRARSARRSRREEVDEGREGGGKGAGGGEAYPPVHPLIYRYAIQALGTTSASTCKILGLMLSSWNFNSCVFSLAF